MTYSRFIAGFSIALVAVSANADNAVSFNLGSGSQAYAGSLGIDFTANTSFSINRVGVFNSTSNPFVADMTVYFYDKANTSAPVFTQVIHTTDSTVLDGGVRYVNATFTLLGGHDYSLVSEGFNPVDQNYNTNVASNPADHTLSTLGGRITWDLTSSGVVLNRYGNAGLYPTFDNQAASWQLPNASFSPVPEPASLAILSMGVGALLRRRRK